MATLAARPAQVSAGWAFRAVWSKSLRSYRVAILAWGIGLGLLLMATAAASPSIATAAGQLSSVTQSFSFFGNPVAIGTPQGYITFKFLGLLPLLIGIWTIIAGAHLTRGDEERGSLDLLLGEPLSRRRLFGEKALAFAIGTVLMGALITLGLMLGLAAAKLPADPGGSLLAGVNIILSAFIYGALGLFFSQFTRTAGAAAGIAGAYMALDFLVAGAMRSSAGPEWVSRLTINYYSELSKPIIANYGANPGALLVLLAISVVLVAASMWLFERRDAGDVVKLWPQRFSQAAARRSQVAPATTLTRAQSDLSLRGVTARALTASRLPIFWWIVGITIYGVYGVFIAQAAEKVFAKAFQSSAVLKVLFSGSNLATNNGFIAAIEFTFIPFIIVLAAMFFAINWAQDLDRGQLENILSEPLPRWRLPLERFVTVVVGTVGLGLVAWLAPLVGGALSGLTLDGGLLASAGLGMIPLGLITGALVYALAGRIGSGTILGIVGGLASLSFLVELLRGMLKLPDWTLNLSIFHVYGEPMSNGINWTGTLIMLGLAVALLALATVRFTREDVHQ
ncbi:MAG TPA: ABC transporter permease subunit [Ktedonobacterales bacterium]|jgi:ABC-2 type transport system permease protein|nr:ABC transporter permease subunit [Ktedonobacterales bacterium]